MNKKVVLCFATLLVLMLCINYSYGRSKIIYSAPTQEQVKEFITKKSINVLAIKEASDFSVVLYQYGHYVLYQDQNNQLYNMGVRVGGDSNKNSVSLGGVASGKTPFVTVIINNKEILKTADVIEITLEDGTVVKEEIVSKGTVVLYENEKNEKPMSYIRLVIYDKDRKMLYET